MLKEALGLEGITLRGARRTLLAKRAIEVLAWLTAAALFAFAAHAVLAAGEDSNARAKSAAASAANITRAEQDHASTTHAQDPRGEEDAAPKERGRRVQRRETNPAAIMRAARTLYIRPMRHLDSKYLEYKLGKYRELTDWDLVLVAEEKAADLVLTVDKTGLNFIFTIMDPRTSVIVTTGKTVAINGLVAAENLGREIIKKIRDVRAGSDGSERRRKSHDREEDENEWSESS